MAEAKEITENEITLTCFGTCGKNARTAKFYEVFTHESDVYLGKYPSNIDTSRWTWKINTDDISELIPAKGLELSKNRSMSAESLKKFKAIKPSVVCGGFE